MLTGHFCEHHSLQMNTLQKYVFIRQSVSQIEKFPDVVCATGEYGSVILYFW